ncbi:MAG: hypothetical protein APF84_01430 [Gracilibacter sp. BRH_c7a]|nr:MAG: hypothetical protein APF84_01430 [Gracilibacter sp. BRH_c7a]
MTTNTSDINLNWNISLAVQAACILEADAPKVGNVNRFHDFADCCLEDFHFSALAVAHPFGFIEKQGVGLTVYKAIKATQALVKTNTNLGIVLLIAPLAMAWCRTKEKQSWLKEIGNVLEGLTIEDTAYVYQAIRLASPSGMGKVKEHDVFNEQSADIPLQEAMKLAADRDMIARQYINNFEQVLEIGYKALGDALTKGLSLPKAIAHTHLFLLTQYPDSLIVRKSGLEKGKEVQTFAQKVWERGGWLTPEGQAYVQEFDHWLRKSGKALNPGTTADLMAAIIFVYLLEKKYLGDMEMVR